MKGSGAMYEEIVVMQERVHEMAVQCYELQRDGKQRFAVIDKYDVKLT